MKLYRRGTTWYTDYRLALATGSLGLHAGVTDGGEAAGVAARRAGAADEETLRKAGFIVPRDGIEPPTRGFSMPRPRGINIGNRSGKTARRRRV
jgi:hypothetical protein